MAGKLYGVGVGPGDPELLTLKALRTIRECDCIALPGEEPKDTVAYRIVREICAELEDKELLAVAMPMTKDPKILEENHRNAAERIEDCLNKEKNVAFLTLGDPTVYSTYMYVHKRMKDRGYRTEIVSGIPSFCAVAARLNMSLVEMEEPLHVIPATYNAENMDEILNLPGTKVLMKNGRKIKKIREKLIEGRSPAVMIEDCGMPSERIFRSPEEIPEDAGYYSLIITKERKEK